MINYGIFVKEETFNGKIYANNALLLATVHLLELGFSNRKSNREWLLVVTVTSRNKQWINIKYL